MERTTRNGRWAGRAALGAALALTLALTPAGRAPAGVGPAVDIKDFRFAPTTLTVPVGTTVMWTNEDEEPHTVTSTGNAFASQGLSHHETFTQTFTRPGRYAYFCALHPHMKATVLVQ